MDKEIDMHSAANVLEVVSTHLHLNLDINFDDQTFLLP
jgi:hypothetical protein